MKKHDFDHMQEIVLREEANIFADPNYLEYRKNWTDYPAQHIVSNFPMNLDVHVTNRCNLRCVMCRRTQLAELGKIGKTGFLDFDLYRKIVDEAAAEGCCAVHLSGNGEPLLHNNIVEMIEYARSKDIMDVFMHTNATLLSKELALDIINAGLTRLIISFDSLVAETYESIRRGAKFDVVIENIKNFASLKKELQRTYPLLRIQMVEMKENKDEREQFDSYFGELADSLGHISYINYLDLDAEDRAIEKKQVRSDFECPQPWQRLSIEWNGRVHACLITSEEELVLGHAKEKSIKEMWHGPLMTRIREKHQAGNFSQIDACVKCGRQYKAK